MSNQSLLEEFFRALRISLTNAFSYSKDHPYFLKSVENLKVKLENLLLAQDPLKISATNKAIVVEGKTLTKSGFYDELARQLHERKIKTVEIRSQITLEELTRFLSVISLSQKEIVKKGGINAILSREPLAHIKIEELDYSQFLHGQGQVLNDVWAYMLKNAAASKDEKELGILAEDFGSLIKRYNQKDVLENEDVPANIGEFLASLKEKDKEKFKKCSKEVFLWMLNNKKSLNENDLEKLKPVFNSFETEDFSNLLVEGISQEENFDDLSLQLFSKFSQQKNHSAIAEDFLLNKSHKIKDNPSSVKKIENLLNKTKEDNLSAVYRNTLDSLVKQTVSSGALFFDQKGLRENFRYILLNIFFSDGPQDNLSLVKDLLEEELNIVFQDKDFNFLKDLKLRLSEKKKEATKPYADFEKKFSSFCEDIVLNRQLAAEEEFLLEMIAYPSRELNYYLDKIFSSEKINKSALVLFFKLFPKNIEEFYLKLKERAQDSEFMAGFIEYLSRLDAEFSLPVLEYLYSSVNELIKYEILKVMEKLKMIDMGFLLMQLDKSPFLIKKNIFSLLMPDEKAVNEAMELMFNIRSFMGKKNQLLIENIQVVADLKYKGATNWLRILSLKKFPWNYQLRRKAKDALKDALKEI